MNEQDLFNINLKEITDPYETRFYESLKNGGVDFATGVPCGVQKHLIAFLSSDPDILHISATRESEAIGIASGAFLTGKCPLVYMQNSGLLESINTITSLLLPYEIPILFAVTWRGAPGENAPQHFINGRIMTEILESIGIPYQDINKDNIEAVVRDSFFNIREKHLPSVILIKRGALK